MKELVLLSLIASYAYCVGRALLRAIRFTPATFAGSIAASISLGLGVVAYTTLVTGLAGFLNREVVLVAGAAVLLLALAADWGVYRIALANFPAQVSSWFHWVRLKSLGYPRWLGMSQVFLLAAVSLGTMATALAPPTAGDALCYHLEVPKRFVERGSIEYLPLTDNSLFPFHMEMLYTLALLISTPVLAQLTHWLVGLLFALAVVELATPLVGCAGAGWAAIVALLVPGVTNQMTAPLNDLAVALYCTLMVSAWVQWQAAFKNRYLVMAGVWGGFALGTKLVAAGFIGVVLIATAVTLLRRVERAFASVSAIAPAKLAPVGRIAGWLSGIKPLAVCALMVCLVGGIWYVRSWYYLGNPIYPYFNSLFGLSGHTRSLLITARNPVTLPWFATMRPEEFGGRGVQFGAVFLAVLPGLVLVRCQPPMRTLLWIALGFTAIWFGVRQDLRFLLPVVGIFATAVIAVANGLRVTRPIAARAAVVCIACLLFFQCLIVLKRAHACLAVACGLESRESYLERTEPTYEMARFVNTNLPKGCRIISQDYRGLYFEPDFVREASLGRHSPYVERGDQLVRHLVSQRFTHVLLVKAHNPEIAAYDEGFIERLGPALDRLTLVHASHFKSRNGDRRDYQLYALPGQSMGGSAAN